MSILDCALCGQTKDCLQKVIDGKEYDVCSDCWETISKQLQGKGRIIKRDVVVIAPPDLRREREDERPFPGVPPKIWLSQKPN